MIKVKVVSRLPLLFAKTRPTSLDQMSQEELERFIPFLVRCFEREDIDFNPSWWPSSVKLKTFLQMPKEFEKVKKAKISNNRYGNC
jgi:hypothetical protein